MMDWLEATIAGGNADLKSLGKLRYCGPKDVSVRTAWGTYDFPPIDWPDLSAFMPRCFYNLDPGAILFLGECASPILRCVPTQGLCEESDVLFRSDDQELRFLSVKHLSDTRLLLLYERGIVVIDNDGSTKWHRLHDDISARITSITRDTVTIETQWPSELAGMQHTYCLIDGKDR
jgi:hypothetical protein